jgi:hypothetical protein
MKRPLIAFKKSGALRRVGKEAQRRGVHAVAESCRLGPIGEEVAEMRVAKFAAHGCALHTERVVF